MGIQYRREIDGLRAIAVLAVVLFHAGIGTAGFVGVDIFFVISGYLITSLLLQEREAGRIDLLAFYARRVRRIVPAAAVVTLCVLIASFWWLAPEAQRHTARSAGAALAFVANVFFQFTTGGYWDAASDEMPLLHLWSLSVEEQFYLLWPALLVFTRSRRVVFVLALVSLGIAEFWIARDSDAAFFQVFSRFWELAAGGLIAASPVRALPRRTGQLGLVVTIFACVVASGHFPGLGALPAVMGAALIIAWIHCGGTHRFLASKPMVALGLVSYSFYLWHWPLLAFYRANGGDALGMRLALCAVALVLASLSYRYIEQPFRKMRWPAGRTVVLGASLSAVVAAGAVAIGLRALPALRAADPSVEATAARIEHDRMPHDCEYDPGDTLPKCPDPSGATEAIWGDSMALALSAGLPGRTLRYTAHGCPPAMGFAKAGCAPQNDAVVPRIRGARTIYIAALWSDYPGIDLAPTFERLKDVPAVVVIGPSPRLRTAVPRCLRMGAECTRTREEFDEQAKPILASLRKQAAAYRNVQVVDVSDDYCTDEACPPILDGVGLYWDTHHPTMSQARRVMSHVAARQPRLTVEAASGASR